MREIEVTSPLGKGVLLFHRMAASEHLGGLSEFTLDLLSEDSNIQLPDILGHTMRADEFARRQDALLRWPCQPLLLYRPFWQLRLLPSHRKTLVLVINAHR